MRKHKIVLTGVGAAIIPYANVFAESTTTGTANADVVNAMTSLSADMIATGQAIVPVALSVLGIGLVVKFGVKIFRIITGR